MLLCLLLLPLFFSLPPLLMFCCICDIVSGHCQLCSSCEIIILIVTVHFRASYCCWHSVLCPFQASSTLLSTSKPYILLKQSHNFGTCFIVFHFQQICGSQALWSKVSFKSKDATAHSRDRDVSLESTASALLHRILLPIVTQTLTALLSILSQSTPSVPL